MNKTAFYKGLISELEKLAYIPFNQPKPQPQQQKKPFYHRPGFWAGVGGVGLAGLGAYSLMNKNAPKPVLPPPSPAPYTGPQDTDFSAATESPSLMGKTKELIDYTGTGIVGNPLKPWQSPWMIANLLKSKVPLAASVAPWLNRGMMGANGLSMVADAFDPNNDMGGGYKALQAVGGATDASAMLLSSVPNLQNNLLQRGLTAAARNQILGKSLTSAAPAAAEAVGSNAARMLAGGPAIAATLTGAAGQMALQHGTETAEDFVNNSGSRASLLNHVRQGLNNPATRNSSLSTLHQWFRGNDGQREQDEMMNPSGWARLGGNTHFWKNNAGANDLSTPVYKHLNDRTYNEYMSKLKELGIKEPVMPQESEPEQISGIYDQSPIY